MTQAASLASRVFDESVSESTRKLRGKRLRHANYLTREQITSLARVMKSSEPGSPEWLDARNRIVLSHAGYARLFANRAQKIYPHLTFEDIEQVAVMGLMRAAESYDPDRGFAFISYACSWMQQYASTAAQKSGLINLPYRDRNEYIKVHQHDEEKREVACERQTLDYRSIDLAEFAEVVLKHLDATDRRIFVLRFGLEGHFPHTFQAIGEILGLWHQAVQARIVRTIKRLKALPSISPYLALLEEDA